MHRNKGWDELGYHFVIGNGTDTHDGQIEVGPRWPKQKWGAHDKTPGNQYNEHGIGICLVGNFDVTRPSPAQVKSLERLVAYLMKTYHVSADHVLGHGETKATECPGRYLNVASIRRACAQMVASSQGPLQADAKGTPIEGQELLVDKRKSVVSAR
jgi:N-acetylmuramoyl-L-alanine amidase CwlA